MTQVLPTSRHSDRVCVCLEYLVLLIIVDIILNKINSNKFLYGDSRFLLGTIVKGYMGTSI